MNRKRLALALLAGILTAQLIAGPFRDGLRRMGTDFPNYYTAAILTTKHMPLREFYDWAWFQRQIHYAGIDGQLGGYIPHTPLTMMPFLPLTAFSPQHAKQVWVVLQLLLLAASVALLAKASGLGTVATAVVVLLAHAAVSANLRLGQYYILILFLLTGALWALLHRRDFLGGALLGLIFALKLYTAPFVFYFAARRQWKALAGFTAAVGAAGLLAAGIFGWNDTWFFVHTVLARGIDGSVNDPYNPGWASMTAFLRRSFMLEPALNPHPFWNAPAAFFFLRGAYTLGILAFALAALAKSETKDDSRGLGFFIIVLFVLSPNEASYHFVLLAVPVAIFLRGAPRRWAAGLLAFYIAVELQLYPWDARLFPKAWLMLGLFLYSGWPFLRLMRPAAAWAVLLFALAISAGGAIARMRVYRVETPQAASLAASERNGLYSEHPVLSADSWMHTVIAGDRYALRRSTLAGTETFRFGGDVLYPAASPASKRVAFEFVTHGHSKICSFDPDRNTLETIVDSGLNPTEPAVSPDGGTIAFISRGSLYIAGSAGYRLLVPGPASNPAFSPDGNRILFARGRPGTRSIQSIPVSGGTATPIVISGDCFDPAVSRDGRLLAFACSETGGRHLWVRDLASGATTRMTSGFCSNDSPAWDSDARSIVFASDCNRGLGLSALYRAEWPPTIGTRK